jgi:hypothetical protein
VPAPALSHHTMPNHSGAATMARNSPN